MNRENKRKSFEKGYYKTHASHEVFTCKVCGRQVIPDGAGTDHRNHCPNCQVGMLISFYFFNYSTAIFFKRIETAVCNTLSTVLTFIVNNWRIKTQRIAFKLNVFTAAACAAAGTNAQLHNSGDVFHFCIPPCRMFKRDAYSKRE